MVRKKSKQRAEHYEKPLAVSGTFEELVKLSVTNADKPEIKKLLKKAAKESK